MTPLSSKFQGNVLILSIDDIIYFTRITAYPSVSNCTHLTHIYIPVWITSFPNYGSNGAGYTACIMPKETMVACNNYFFKARITYYVPYDLIDTYKNDSKWNGRNSTFKDIEEWNG